MRVSRRTILLGLFVAGSGPKLNRSSAGNAPPADCLGRDSIVNIAPGRIGALRLDLPLRELHRLCPKSRDTTAHGDETVDTAIVISRPGLSVVGRIATIASDEGETPYHVDSSRVIDRWSVVGSAGLLPGGVPLSAPWDSLVRAFGTPRIEPLNGDVFVWFCERVPAMTFEFDDPVYYTEHASVSRDSYRSALSGKRIRSVDLPAKAGAQSKSPACD